MGVGLSKLPPEPQKKNEKLETLNKDVDTPVPHEEEKNLLSKQPKSKSMQILRKSSRELHKLTYGLASSLSEVRKNEGNISV
ncbi:hypothetical protein KM1_055930, partial [Entamoeba histolytica HM-3:IMSS]